MRREPTTKVVDRKAHPNRRTAGDEQIGSFRELDADELGDLCSRILRRRADDAGEMQLRLVGALSFHAPSVGRHTSSGRQR